MAEKDSKSEVGEDVDEDEKQAAKQEGLALSAIPDSVIVKFKAAGGAPQLLPAKKKIKCKTTMEFKAIYDHLRLLLTQDKAEASLFCYVSTNHISPAMDETLANVSLLYGRTNTKGVCELEVAYSLTPAWG